VAFGLAGQEEIGVSYTRFDIGDLPLFDEPQSPGFDGSTYSHAFDYERLNAQTKRVYELIKDGVWRTLDEISTATGDPPASVSARLRDLRKAAFGSHLIERRARGERSRGLFEYSMHGGKR
jgi:hypothetical protein